MNEAPDFNDDGLKKREICFTLDKTGQEAHSALLQPFIRHCVLCHKGTFRPGRIIYWGAEKPPFSLNK